MRTLYIDRDPATFEDISLHLQGYHIEPRDGPHFVKLFADAQFFSCQWCRSCILLKNLTNKHKYQGLQLNSSHRQYTSASATRNSRYRVICLVTLATLRTTSPSASLSSSRVQAKLSPASHRERYFDLPRFYRQACQIAQQEHSPIYYTS